MTGAQPSRFMLFLLILPAAGFIFLFLAVTMAMILLQSVGLYSLIGDSDSRWITGRRCSTATSSTPFFFR